MLAECSATVNHMVRGCVSTGDKSMRMFPEAVGVHVKSIQEPFIVISAISGAVHLEMNQCSSRSPMVRKAT